MRSSRPGRYGACKGKGKFGKLGGGKSCRLIEMFMVPLGELGVIVLLSFPLSIWCSNSKAISCSQLYSKLSVH